LSAPFKETKQNVLSVMILDLRPCLNKRALFYLTDRYGAKLAAESQDVKIDLQDKNRAIASAANGLDKPIPIRAANAATALGYHGQPVNLHLPQSQEWLVQAKSFGLSAESYYARTDGFNVPYNRQIPGSLPEVWMRQSIAERLVLVNGLLSALDLEVHLFDAYRPIKMQQALWDHFIEMGRHRLETTDPVKLREYAGQFASEPTGFDPHDSLTWPTHNTGGAVDVTLRDKASGVLLDLGTYFDEATPRTFTDAFELEVGNETEDNGKGSALGHRRILYNAMIRFGFANYPYEWWHYDYGTQMWLQNGGGLPGVTEAWYGPALLPA
jgi:zinc D-Ala-D-Ala dipeptidase